MKVTTIVNKPGPVLTNPRNVKVGTVYSWGSKKESYLRVAGGSVCLSNWDVLLLVHPHFSAGSLDVQIADTAELTITYEG